MSARTLVVVAGEDAFENAVDARITCALTCDIIYFSGLLNDHADLGHPGPVWVASLLR